MNRVAKITIILLITILCNQSVLFAETEHDEILLPRIDLLPTEPCPVTETPEVKIKPFTPIQPEKPKQTTLKPPIIILQPSKPIRQIEIEKTVESIPTSDYTADFNKPYNEVFITALSALEKSPINVLSFDTTSGKISCSYHNIKTIYGIVEGKSKNSSKFKLISTDNNYNIPMIVAESVFQDIKKEFSKKEN